MLNHLLAIFASFASSRIKISNLPSDVSYPIWSCEAQKGSAPTKRFLTSGALQISLTQLTSRAIACRLVPTFTQLY